MDSSPVSLSLLLKAILCSFVVILASMLFQGSKEPYLIICDVGQGDAIYLHFSNGFDMLIDGGPSENVLECLGEYMPFYDKHIDMIFITHPHLDHYGGIQYVLKKYSVSTIVVPNVTTSSTTYARLLNNAKEVSDVIYIDKPIRISIQDNEYVDILWPQKTFIDSHARTSVNSSIPLTAYDPNAFSLVQNLTYHRLKVLFTGDSPDYILEDLIKTNSIGNVDILKVPHHGSSDGLNRTVIESLEPKLALLSYGKKNRYSHPSPDVIGMLEQKKIQHRATAERGSIKVTLYRDSWKVSYSCSFLFLSC